MLYFEEQLLPPLQKRRPGIGVISTRRHWFFRPHSLHLAARAPATPVSAWHAPWAQPGGCPERAPRAARTLPRATIFLVWARENQMLQDRCRKPPQRTLIAGSATTGYVNPPPRCKTLMTISFPSMDRE